MSWAVGPVIWITTSYMATKDKGVSQRLILMHGKDAFLLFHTSNLICSSRIPPAEIQTCLTTTLKTYVYVLMLCKITKEVDKLTFGSSIFSPVGAAPVSNTLHLPRGEESRMTRVISLGSQRSRIDGQSLKELKGEGKAEVEYSCTFLSCRCQYIQLTRSFMHGKRNHKYIIRLHCGCSKL